MHPWRTVVADEVEVWTPNPLCFVLQRARIRRPGAGGEKDAAAILRVAEAACRRPEAVRGLVSSILRSVGSWRRQLQAAGRAFEEDFTEGLARVRDAWIEGVPEAQVRQ